LKLDKREITQAYRNEKRIVTEWKVDRSDNIEELEKYFTKNAHVPHADVSSVILVVVHY
jgi:hypothetical protein